MTYKICIDPGHYGKYNRSPANKKYYESDMVWKLHLLQKKYLEEYGFEVITTRSKQANDLALHTRGTKSKGCVLFISDHSNATGSGVDESIDHVAVYHLTSDTTTKCDDISKEIAKKLAPIIADVMDTEDGYKVLTRKAGNDRNGDGIMNDNYYGVLHGARTVGTPGLILEHSFHTNTRSTNWLLNDDNLDKLAKAEADAIAEYFGMTVTSKQETEKKDDLVTDKNVGNKTEAKVTCFKKYTGKSGSIVTALNSIGEKSSYDYRSKIAVANSINDYAGTAVQNTEMVKLLKQGCLIKPDAKNVMYFPEYTGKSGSIVTALNSLKVESSFAYRKKIAKANNISAYIGTAKQNTKMVNLLKQGKLVKP